MKAVEKLMVGVATELQVVVGKALMQGVAQFFVVNFGTPVLEYGAQAFVLARIVGKNKDLVTGILIFADVFLYQIKIFVEEGLGLCFKAQGLFGAEAAGLVQQEQGTAAEVVEQLVAVDQLGGGGDFLVATFCFHKSLLLFYHLLHNLIHALANQVGAVYPYQHFRRKGLGQGGEVFAVFTGPQLGNEGDFVKAAL